jgi:hypothetical protein
LTTSLSFCYLSSLDVPFNIVPTASFFIFLLLLARRPNSGVRFKNGFKREDPRRLKMLTLFEMDFDEKYIFKEPI